MNDPNPVPVYFSVRYILWLAWSNAITVLSTLQGIFAAVMLAADGDPTHPLLSHNTVRWIILGNAVLTGVLAQINRRSPPPSKVAVPLSSIPLEKS